MALTPIEGRQSLPILRPVAGGAPQGLVPDASLPVRSVETCRVWTRGTVPCFEGFRRRGRLGWRRFGRRADDCGDKRLLAW